MKLMTLAMLALPSVAAAQMNESAARRVIDTQLSTGVTNPPGPSVPGSEAARLLGRTAPAQPGPDPSIPGIVPGTGASPFGVPTAGTSRR